MLELCEHNNYHCYRCEVKLLKLTIDELQQQNKLLIDALIAERDAALLWDGIGTVNRINSTLQQIQGNQES